MSASELNQKRLALEAQLKQFSEHLHGMRNALLLITRELVALVKSGNLDETSLACEITARVIETQRSIAITGDARGLAN